ncbi:hypothetical protein SeLEV6574_g05681 [Synchytrium endobioticum]|uniref:Uncharacterized protein n=1 Tax=Synchytrium endobioticum TaxID=286115 RepID=A0A507CT11_9FUNG|nr:hypothetical protein SeLEV6574_g05681 [Synchytrium endobioticum]
MGESSNIPHSTYQLASIQADSRQVKGIPHYVVSLFLLLPTPENVPPEYLELATRYHRLVVDQEYQHFSTDDEQNKISGDASTLRQKYERAASAASGSAGSIDDSIWVERWNDAQLLRRAYANAVDLRDLMFAVLLQEGIPFKVEDVRTPTYRMSMAHNEFAVEGHKCLRELTKLFRRTQAENVDVWVAAYEKRLKDQIRLALGGSDDLFSPTDINVFDMVVVNEKVAQVNKAFESRTIPMVSSFIQADLIHSCWSTWCIGNTDSLFIHGDRFNYAIDLVKTLPFLQLAAGRMKLMDLSLSAFLEQRKQLPRTEWSTTEIKKWDETIVSMRETRKKYQRVVVKLRTKWSNMWRGLLGDDVGPHFEKIEFALDNALRERSAQNIDLPADVMEVLEQLPIPENVPLAYLNLASRFNTVKYLMSGEERSKKLRDIYENAASAASSSGGAGPSSNPVMNEHIGVDSVAARDHGSSSGHFQGLSQDTSRTMTEHGQTSSRRNRQRRGPSSRDMLE